MTIEIDRPILAGTCKGEITGSVGYNACNHAYWTSTNLVNLLNGAEVPGQIIGPIEVISKKNASDLFKMCCRQGRTHLASTVAGARRNLPESKGCNFRQFKTF
jgi:hypothetical protein